MKPSILQIKGKGMKEENVHTVLTQEFIERWGDRCDIPTVKMKEIYEELKNTIGDYTKRKCNIHLSNLFSINLFGRSKEVNYRNVRTGERLVKSRTNTQVYRCTLAPKLRYPGE